MSESTRQQEKAHQETAHNFGWSFQSLFVWFRLIGINLSPTRKSSTLLGTLYQISIALFNILVNVASTIVIINFVMSLSGSTMSLNVVIDLFVELTNNSGIHLFLFYLSWNSNWTKLCNILHQLEPHFQPCYFYSFRKAARFGLAFVLAVS